MSLGDYPGLETIHILLNQTEKQLWREAAQTVTLDASDCLERAVEHVADAIVQVEEAAEAEDAT